MTTEQETLDKISSWATDKYTSAAPSLLSGAAAGAGATTTSTAAPTAQPAPAGTSLLAAAAKPKVDVASWYRSTLGRDGDQAGIGYWQKAIDDGMDAQQAYGMFQQAAGDNKEQVKPSSWAAANTYEGPQSSNKGSVVDDWYRNTMGREATPAEQAQWGAKWAGATNPAASQDVYRQFVEENRGAMKGEMDLAAASQISRLNGNGQAAPQPASGTDGLSTRTIDPATETVRGQISSLLAEDSQVLQQARAEGMRTAFDRGLGNSSIAASAGADALIRAATGIGTTDSGYYNEAANYNVAAKNQLFMYDRDQANQFKKLEMQYGSEAASRMMQMQIAQMQNSTTQAGQSNQMTIAQMQDATSRWNAEQAAGRDVSNQKLGVANNIIGNMDMSPDRKAAMLQELGFGTMAQPGVPGTGLAGAVFVLDSIGAELSGSPGTSNGEQYYTG